MVPASSALFAGIYRAVVGGPLDQPVRLGALAFAGWLGLVLTALNLVPLGQLDGGHVAYAIFGRRWAARLGGLALGLMVAGILYSGHWLMWAFVAWLVAGRGHPPARDETAPIGAGRGLLAALTLALFVAIVAPWPV